MNRQNVIKALSIVTSKLYALEVYWLLGGSGALMAQGLDITPHDLDILVEKNDLDKVLLEFNGYIDTRINSSRALIVAGVPVEIYILGKHGDEEVIKLEGLKITVNTLSEDLKYYEHREGKEWAVEMIRKKIQRF